MRRYAVISDIHGNRWALERLLDDTKRRGIERIINLGDSLYGPLDPKGTAEILIRMNLTSVLGNEDRTIISSAKSESSPTIRYVQQNLEQKHFEWLRQMPSTLIVDGNLFACHASPHSDTQYFFWDVRRDGVVMGNYEAMSEMVRNTGCSILLCGHDHVARSVQLQNNLLAADPGSVGLPAYTDELPHPHVMQTGSPHARYAVVIEDRGKWAVEHILLEYDWEAAAVKAAENGRQDWASWLRTGRASLD